MRRNLKLPIPSLPYMHIKKKLSHYKNKEQKKEKRIGLYTLLPMLVSGTTVKILYHFGELRCICENDFGIKTIGKVEGKKYPANGK